MPVKNTHYLDVDTKLTNYISVPRVTQNDDVFFIVRILDDGRPVSLTSVQTFLLASLKPNKETILTVGTVSGDEISFKIESAALNVKGRVQAAVQLYYTDGRTSTIPFYYEVIADSSVDYVPDTSETSLIQLVLGDAPFVIEAAQSATIGAEDAAAQTLEALDNFDTEKSVAIQELDDVKEENRINWKQEVATVALRDSTYPNPQIGDTVRITGEARIDRFNGTEWITTDRYNPAVVDELTGKLAEEAQKVESLNADKASKSEVQTLATNKADISYVDNKVAQIGDAKPSGVYATLTALQTAFPTGNGKNIYLVTGDGKWYFWNGSAWTAGGVYQSTGIANNSIVPEQTTFIENTFLVTLERGSLSSGVPVGETARNRLRSVETFKHPRSLKISRKNPNILFGISTYVNGIYDGIDRGWIDKDTFEIEANKEMRFNLQKKNGSDFTDDEILSLSKQFVVSYSFSASDKFITEENTNEIKQMKSTITKLKSKEITLNSNDFMTGSLHNGIAYEIVSNPTRIVTKNKLRVNKDDVITFHKSFSNYFYGLSVMNENGVWNGIDYGWSNKLTFTIPQDGYISLNLRFVDDRIITPNNFNDISSNVFTISTTFQTYAEEKIRGIEVQLKNDKKMNAINTIMVEYGRKNGASYVFARIPKYTIDGNKIVPKVKLTSRDGSLTGQKLSALRYSKENDTIFTINAGLFNISSAMPVGQTIIDGVSVINTPMTSDNGVPIHPEQCYPLAIDKDYNLTTYPRNVDTQTMLADGVKFAITGWGRLVNNFQVDIAEIEKEIVHGSYRYIRQSIGQFQNGDYCICSVDMSRGTVVNEAGLYYQDLAQILVDKGVKFAYSLDGGGSTSTILGKRQLNPTYEGAEGRAVPTVITFDIL